MPETLSVQPLWAQPTTEFRHTWEGLINVDQFRWLVRKDMLGQLEMVKKELKAEHLRAVGMFDDELCVLGINPKDFREKERHPRLNFQVLDYIIDELMDIGINPMFTTTFMPKALASGTGTVFQTKNNVTPPKDWGEWSELVTETLQHFVWRYGKERVQTWYGEVWNEPNLTPSFFTGSKDDFFRLWKETFEAVKAVLPEMRVGGPSTARCEWIEDFITWTRANGCEPDYIIGHIYNADSETDALSPFDGPQEDKESKSPHYADSVVRGCRQLLNSLDFKGELQWNEWGRHWYASEPHREKPHEAAYVVKSMAEISQHVDWLAHWCISDIYNQLGYNKEAFAGHYGLLNLQGLRKPAYQAYQLLGRMGEARVPVDEPSGSKSRGAIVTRERGYTAALCYDYQHENPDLNEALEVSIALPPGGKAEAIAVYAVDLEENNAVTRWQALGSPDYLTREQTVALRAQDQITPSTREVKQVDGCLKTTMATSSVSLVEWREANR